MIHTDSKTDSTTVSNTPTQIDQWKEHDDMLRFVSLSNGSLLMHEPTLDRSQFETPCMFLRYRLQARSTCFESNSGATTLLNFKRKSLTGKVNFTAMTDSITFIELSHNNLSGSRFCTFAESNGKI